uniref:Peptidase S1 domain-containing protein n=1 Tax=Panagrolaimus sp. ES5 TaxID=591445 RepID=A0AC34F1J5_9BILA
MFKYFLFLVIFTKSTLIYGFNENRIRNGSITPSNLFQFAVHLRYGCSGTIISTRHVLTAAHCFDAKKVLKTEHDTYRFVGIICK